MAGGYDTGEADWDFLFQQQRFAAEASVRYVAPHRRLTNVVGTLGPAADTTETESFVLPRFGVSVGMGEHLRCLASYREPWEGHANYGTGWTYSAAALEQHFSSEDYGLTCALGGNLGPGRIGVLGGVSYQRVHYRLLQAFGPGLPGVTNVDDDGVAWRAGLSYEIPEYALRASLIYNAAVGYHMTGTFSAFGTTMPVFGDLTMPQSVELKAQSGIAPGWLAFGSVKWANWNVVDSMPLCAVGTPACTQAFAVSGLTLQWHDTWTVTLGAAHAFTEKFALAGAVTWDQGASSGFTSQTDVWNLSLSGAFTPNPNVAVTAGGSVGILTGGSVNTHTLSGGVANPFGYTASFGDDLVYSLNLSAGVKF